MAINVILRSNDWGAGKSWLALSYRNQANDQVRLAYDGEYRNDTYRSTDTEDCPEKGLFVFDQWETMLGQDFVASVISCIGHVQSGKFPYNALIIDNGTLFQDQFDIAMRDKSVAQEICDALGITPKHQNFLSYRFNVNDSAAYYYLVKSAIRGFLLTLRKASIDVIVTSESKNVWKNYGSRDKSNPQTIMGKTTKLWDPWLQMSDLILVLERISGSRLEGTAKLTPWPTARLDTFNPKCSIVGIAPEFVFKDWDVFWKMVDLRKVPDSAMLGNLNVPVAIESLNIDSIADAKVAIVNHAVGTGFAPSFAAAPALVRKMGEKYGLEPSLALPQFNQWIDAINTELADEG